MDASFKRLCIDDAVDDPVYDLKANWPRCCDFIHAALAMGRGVLVLCDAGSSQSGATVIAYLIFLLRRPAGECLAIAQRARSCVNPNEGFWAQLLSWERDQLGNASIPGGAHMHEIRPLLWLGSLEAAQDWENLKKNGITHILSCGRGLQTPLPDGVQPLAALEIDDLDEVDILEHLPQTSDEIRDFLASGCGAILIHCASGRSRSASIVIAYLMREEKLSYPEAFKSVVSIRSVVQPNSGFCKQLQWYSHNGCRLALQGKDASKSYREIPEFSKLLRKYSVDDVLALVAAAGAGEENCRDPNALQKALDALDRLQNAVPMNEHAKLEKQRQSRRINLTLDQL
eukprot:TRINITY_DN21600_c0_g1_i1.p1 TRINITY_DN21600_c0_g1~~TRINITY_DN21600_c0_g1_i1.p1  ORF type:complete len:343 (+),score=45.31 TRINITY_DN21600_c0_g1_i1:244-1272(+)